MLSDSRPSTRVICFGGSCLKIECNGRRAAEIVEFLFGQNLEDNPDPESLYLNYQVSSRSDSSRLVLYREETIIYDGTSAATLADLLLGDGSRNLADRSEGGLLFHAAGLSQTGKGLIVPGQAGSGKSTLTAWLLSKGFHYLTDELLFVPFESNHIQGLARPLNLKRPSRAVLLPYFDVARHAPEIISNSTNDLVPANLISPEIRISRPPPGLILFPHYQAGSDFTLRRLTGAQTGLELMKHLVNARNLPGYGFREVSRLARHVPAYQISYAGFSQIDNQIENLLEAQPGYFRMSGK